MSSDQTSIFPSSDDDLSPLEHDILNEYTKLANNMKTLALLLASLAGQPTAEILDSLRQLERKTPLVFTALKSSVYNIVLQQEIYSEDREVVRDEEEQEQ